MFFTILWISLIDIILPICLLNLSLNAEIVKRKEIWQRLAQNLKFLIKCVARTTIYSIVVT